MALAATATLSTPDLEPYQVAMIPSARDDVAAVSYPILYDIAVTVDLSGEQPILHAVQEMTYVNTEDAPMDEVYFILHPNAPGRGGSLNVEGLAVDGVSRAPAYELDRFALRVDLGRGIPPGQTAQIAMTYTVTVPSGNHYNYGTFNYQDNVLTLANFYPMLAVYDDHWNLEIPPGYGDPAFSETSLFRVSLTVPGEMVVAMSGTTIDRRQNDDGTVTLTALSGPMREFMIAMSPDFEVASDIQGDTIINSYYKNGDEEGGALVLQYIIDSLRIYNRDFGVYPFAELDIVEAPVTAGGVEYPGLILMAASRYGMEGDTFEFAAVHETIHQWWYSVVGNDQVDTPWLDESLTNYSTVFYYQAVYNRQAAEGVIQQRFRNKYEEALAAGRDQVVGQPVSAFTAKDYGTIVYGKGPLFFHALRERVGDAVYLDIMRAYYQDRKYKIATPEDFLRVAEAVSGQNIHDLYEQWILTAQD